jgi:hypothetical protein
MEESYHLLVCHGPKAAKHWVITPVTVIRLARLNSVASAFPVACCGVSELILNRRFSALCRGELQL